MINVIYWYVYLDRYCIFHNNATLSFEIYVRLSATFKGKFTQLPFKIEVCFFVCKFLLIMSIYSRHFFLLVGRICFATYMDVFVYCKTFYIMRDCALYVNLWPGRLYHHVLSRIFKGFCHAYFFKVRLRKSQCPAGLGIGPRRIRVARKHNINY